MRRRVFVEEQGVPESLEWDELDAVAFHVVAIEADRVVGTGRLVELGISVGRVGRMAVDRERRRQGIGHAILERLEREAVARGMKQLVLHAQLQALGFYERGGYIANGEPFEEAGIMHREMQKDLN